MGFKNGFSGFVVGFIAGFIAYPINEIYGLAIAIIAAGLISRGTVSGAISSAFLGALLPISTYLPSLYGAIQSNDISLLFALLLIVTRILNVSNLYFLFIAAVGGAIFGYIGNKTLTPKTETE
ncbi:MAG: hypothetical protein ACP6IS_01955 [Candidatus Asgardarchaeia archaeon]